MNTLGFVFSILMILSFGFSLCFEKQVTGQRLRTTHLGHWHANRKILVQCETEFYNSLPHKIPVLKKNKSTQIPPSGEHTPKIIKINPSCARLNLFPLTDEDKEKHRLLYETAAKLLKFFYGKSLFEDKPHTEIHFLNAFLQAVKTTIQQNKPLHLEKLQFKEPKQQLIYYKMLKGNKNSLQGYPSLMEYIKLEPQASKICLAHSHPNLIAVLFNSKVSLKIYNTLHQRHAPHMTKEIIERFCSEAHMPIYNADIFELVDLGKSRHKKEIKKIFLGEDEQTLISLKKTAVL